MTGAKKTILEDCWVSFRSLPAWVQIWVALILVPVNMASLAFVGQPMGLWVAILANIAMAMNLPVMMIERGFSRAMAFPHLIPWTILIAILIFAPPAATGPYDTYLNVLLITNIVSLLFDFPDAINWLRGKRAVAGRF